MSKIKMSEALLDIFCYVRDCKAYTFSRARVKHPNGEGKWPDIHAAVSYEFFHSIPDAAFEKAGIRRCSGNFEIIWNATAQETWLNRLKVWENTPVGQLSMQEVELYPYGE